MPATRENAPSLETPNSAPESATAIRVDGPFVDWMTRLMDPTRLAALDAARRAGAGADDGFDSWVRLAAKLLHTPVALISFIDDQRQLLKSFQGLGEPYASTREAPLSHSLCKYVVAGEQPLVLDDARLSQVRDNPGVRDAGVVAYLGVPLRANDEAIGTFCVFDVKPRVWGEQDVALLEEFARAVEAQIALSLANAELAERECLLESVLQLMPTGMVLRNLEGKVVRTNPAVEKILGRSAEELASGDFWQFMHPDDVEASATLRERVLSGEEGAVCITRRCLHKDGHYVWARISASALRDPNGGAQGTIAVLEDVTAERNAAAELARQAHVYQAIVQSIPRGAVLMFDREFRYIAADGPELFSAVGLEKTQLEGHTMYDVASPANVAGLEAAYRRALAGEPSSFEAQRNGRQLLARVAPIREENQVDAGLVFIQDVTEERQQQEAVRRSKSMFEATIGHIQDGVALLDGQWNIVLANRAYADLFGLREDQLVGLPRAQFMAHVATLVDDPAGFMARLATDQGAPDRSDDFVLLRPRRRVIRRTRTALELPDGSGTGYLVIWQDITAESELKAVREREAFCDALTGIANRRAADQAIERALLGWERAQSPACIALIDVDHFKRVNDQFGHSAGDDVLKGIAACLCRVARSSDVVARWGGEEFVAVLPVSLEGALSFCERIRKTIEASEFPDLGRVTVSIGVAQLERGDSAQSVLQRADRCLYEAKTAGRNRVRS
jgi:diguanylate cyclase (GGDEF)-like protein/PAS domain S-box-containing protein